MIWTILGISTAILAVFCITVAETLVGQPVFESARQFVAMGFATAGGVALLLGRAIAARDASREAASRRFLLFDLRYWGPMLIVMSVITVFIRPLRASYDKPVALARVVHPQPAPAPKPPPPPVVAKAPVFPKMRMQGVIYRETQPFVILNGQSYTIGDHVGDVVVRAIDRTSVMIELQGETKVLRIN